MTFEVTFNDIESNEFVYVLNESNANHSKYIDFQSILSQTVTVSIGFE